MSHRYQLPDSRHIDWADTRRECLDLLYVFLVAGLFLLFVGALAYGLAVVLSLIASALVMPS